MKHDSNAVHTFLEKVLNALKIKYPTFQKFVYFSDGAGSPCKNYKAFSNLCHHESNFGLNAEWNFFGSSHRKSPCGDIILKSELLVSSVKMCISEREGDTSTGCGTYPRISDEAQMNTHQASYLVSICLIFVFILASSVLCGEVRLQSNTDM